MVDISVDSAGRNNVTFVTAVVRNDRNTPQVIKLRNCLDGPVWPPRCGTVTAPAWDGQTWEQTIGPGQQIGMGYACPASPAPTETPLEVVTASRTGETDEESPTAVIASLEEWAPERIAIETEQ